MKQTTLLILLTIVYASSIAQTWQRTYGYAGSAEISKAVKCSYDEGFILGVDKNNHSIFIIKSNINGEILWQKYIKAISSDYLILSHFNTCNSGSIALTGGYYSGSDIRSFVINFDTCIENYTCNTINIHPNTVGNYGKFIFNYPGSDELLLMTYAAGTWPYEPNQFWKVNTLGEVLWEKQILSSYQTYFSGTEFQQMCLTSDGGSLLAGYTYYPYDTTNYPWDGILQPCLVKHDSLGNRQWVYPPMSGADTNRIGFFNACVQVGDTYYAAGSNYNYGPGHFLQPLVARFDLNGNLLSYVSSGPDTMYHSLSQVLPVSDTSILLISAANTVYTDPNYLMVFIADTIGNFTKGFIRHDLIVSQFGDEVAKMRDNKFIIPCSYPIGGLSSLTDIVAIKLNANLEYDSIYTQPFTYDSLCPYPIVSDTVVCNCEPFVSAKEAQELQQSLTIVPNPAIDWIAVGMPQALQQAGTLRLYNMLGRVLYEAMLPPGTKQTNISCVGWKAGLYLVRCQSGGKVVSGKVVVGP
ncbi:MAG TPA: T9SS type A sorting domain-containing protein [Bacteroidales bacterium]|nr:T9SS type A sorting domain-containing protein [Bacteroidales bacterium]